MAGKILDLSDLTPEYNYVRIDRIIKTVEDGPDSEVKYVTEPVVLKAYVFGPRCPVTVKSALKQVKDRIRDVKNERGYITDEDFAEYARDSLMQLIIGITFDEADLLAADEEKTQATMKHLGYWIGEDSENPEVPAETGTQEMISTTQESSPISA